MGAGVLNLVAERGVEKWFSCIVKVTDQFLKQGNNNNRFPELDDAAATTKVFLLLRGSVSYLEVVKTLKQKKYA